MLLGAAREAYHEAAREIGDARDDALVRADRTMGAAIYVMHNSADARPAVMLRLVEGGASGSRIDATSKTGDADP
jgi:hypothetical protein